MKQKRSAGMRTSRRGIWLLAQPRSGASVRRSAHFFIRLKTESPLHESRRLGACRAQRLIFTKTDQKPSKKQENMKKTQKKLELSAPTPL